MISAHDLVTFLLIWVLIGSLIWLLLVHVGAIKGGFVLVEMRQGSPVSLFWAARATAVSILVWPLFVAIAVKRRRQVWVALKRVVWR